MSNTLTDNTAELEQKVTEIIALLPMETGAKLTEIGWERYGENEQEAIKKLVTLITAREQQARLDELNFAKNEVARSRTMYLTHDDPTGSQAIKIRSHLRDEIVQDLDVRIKAISTTKQEGKS